MSGRLWNLRRPATLLILLLAAVFLERPETRALDLSHYLDEGESLLHGIPGAVSYRMPLATVLAALVSHHLLPAQAQALVIAAQAALLLALCGLLCSSAILPFLATLVLLAGAKMFPCPDYPESFYAALVLLAAGLMVWRAQKPSKTRTFLLALSLGATFLFRSPLAFFPPLLAAFELLRSPRPRTRERLIDAGILCVVPYLFLAPWLRLNWIAYGEIVPFEYTAVYSNAVSGALGLVKGVEGPWERFLPPGEPVLRWAAGEIARHPARYLSAVAQRLFYVLSLHPVLSAAGFLALWWRRRERAFQPLGLLAGYYLAIHCLMTVLPRYFDPLWPLLALAAAAAPRWPAFGLAPAGIAAGVGWARGILVMALAAVMALCAYTERLVSAYAGPAAAYAAWTSEGLERFDLAVASFPDDAWLLLRRGRRRAERGDLPGAADDFSRALVARPGDARLSLELDWARALQGDEGALMRRRDEPAAPNEESFDARIYQANINLRRGRIRAAHESLADAKKMHEAAVFVHDPVSPRDREIESALRAFDSGFVQRAARVIGGRPEKERRMMLAALEPLSPETPGFRLEQARLALGQGDRRAAVGFLERALRSGPTEEERLRIAALYRGAEEYRTALELLGPMLLSRPRSAGLWLERAELEARTGERAAALVSLARADGLKPETVAHRRRIVLLYGELQECRRVRVLLAQMLRSQPLDGELLLARAECEAQGGERSAALDSLARAEGSAPPDDGRSRRIIRLYGELKEFGRARALLTPLLRASSRDSGLWLVRAELEARAGERGEALKSLARAVSLGVSSEELRRRVIGLYRELNEPQRALAALQLLQESRSGDAGLWLEKAELEARLGERDAAVASTRRAEALTPDDEHRRRIAGLYRRFKEFRPALAALTPVLERRPRDAGLWLERAELEAETGAREEALGSLGRADASGLDDAARRRGAALYRRLQEPGRALALLVPLLASRPEDVELLIECAELEAQANRKGAALEFLSRAERLDADDELRRRVALNYQSLADYGRALAILEDLIRRNPKEGTFYSDKGLCEYLKGDAAAAIGDLEKAIRLKPEFVPPYLSLGAIHAAQGRHEDSLKIYSEGLARNPESEILSETIRYATRTRLGTTETRKEK